MARHCFVFAFYMCRIKLKAVHKFASTAAAVEDISAMQEGKMSKSLKKFLTDEVVNKGKGKDKLAVVDKALGESWTCRC
jgi:nucleolar protein 58